VVVSDGTHLLVDALRGGDEPVQIARKFPSACVVVGEQRVAAAHTAVQDLGAEVLVLDDGFQHRYLNRSLDIVVIDAECDLTREPLLPAGLRREPLEGLRRADILAVARGDPAALPEWMERLAHFSAATIVRFTHCLQSVCRAIDHQPEAVESIRSLPMLAFSAIGRPERFVQDMRASGLHVVDAVAFPDHHWYAARDFDRLAERMKSIGAQCALTTEKDAMRLSVGDGWRSSGMRDVPVYYVRMSVRFTMGESALLEAVEQCMRNTGKS
jgi:tetraacyldisaccharide 4'-kinase